MHHPSAAQVDTVIARLEAAALIPTVRFEIREAEVRHWPAAEHACETVVCVAGAYALAIFNAGEAPQNWRWKASPIGYQQLICPKRYYDTPIDYHMGAQLMARDLGFPTTTALLDWAETHPDLWGNTSGAAMFSSMSAYDRSRYFTGCESLRDVIDHWRAVRIRLARFLQSRYLDVTGLSQRDAVAFFYRETIAAARCYAAAARGYTGVVAGAC